MNYNEAYEYISAALLNAQLPFPVSEKMKEATFDKFVTQVGLRSLSKKKVETISSFTNNVGTILSPDFTGKIYKVESTSSTGSRVLPYMDESMAITTPTSTDTDAVKNMGYWIKKKSSEIPLTAITVSEFSGDSTITLSCQEDHNLVSGEYVKLYGINDLDSSGNQSIWDENVNNKIHKVISISDSDTFVIKVYGMDIGTDSPDTVFGDLLESQAWEIYLNKSPESNIKVYYYASPNTRSRSQGNLSSENKRTSLYRNVDLESEELSMAAVHYAIGSLIALSGDEKRSNFHMQAGGAQEKAYMDTKKYMEANYDIIPSPLKDFV